MGKDDRNLDLDKKVNIPLVSSVFVSETMSVVFWFYAADLRDFKLLIEKKF